MFIRNEAFKRGGLASNIAGTLDSETRNISVRVEDSLFEENGCNPSNPTVSGGKMHLNFGSHNSNNFKSNRFT